MTNICSSVIDHSHDHLSINPCSHYSLPDPVSLSHLCYSSVSLSLSLHSSRFAFSAQPPLAPSLFFPSLSTTHLNMGDPSSNRVDASPRFPSLPMGVSPSPAHATPPSIAGICKIGAFPVLCSMVEIVTILESGSFISHLHCYFTLPRGTHMWSHWMWREDCGSFSGQRREFHRSFSRWTCC